MLQVSVFSGRPLVAFLVVSAVLGGLMAGFFFAYSVSVVGAVNYPTLLAHGFAVRFVEGGAFAWTPALAGISGRRVILSVRLQHPAIQAHAYGCASAVPCLVTAEIPQAYIFRRVVVGVVLVAAFQTLEALAVAIVRVREPTV
jgi:hypothetical protein